MRTILNSLYHGRFFFYIAIGLLIIDWLQGFIDFDYFINWLIQQSQDNKFYFFLFLLLSSVLETMFALSFYFPGSVVLATVLLTLSSKLDFGNLILPIIVIWIGVILGIFINYILGKYFSSFVDKLGHKNIITSTRKLIDKYGSFTSFFFSAHPNYIGTLYLVSGLMSISIKKMIPLTILGTITSITIWSMIFINTSKMIEQSSINHTYFLSIICVILGFLWGIFKTLKTKKLN